MKIYLCTFYMVLNQPLQSTFALPFFSDERLHVLSSAVFAVLRYMNSTTQFVARLVPLGQTVAATEPSRTLQ